jgi:hypothetical protein
MSRIDCLNRRRFLGLTGLGAAGLAFVPRMRRVRADTPPRARRLLVLHLAGGIRSSAAFHASGETHYNPYGLIEGTGTAFALGRLLDDSPPGTPPLGDDEYTLGAAWSGAVLPRFREVAGQLSVIGTWSEARGDHLRARIEEPTGSADGADPGLLTRLVAGMSAGGDLDMPAFHLVPDALFGAAPPALARHAPVALQSWSSLPNESAADPFAVDRTAGGWLGSPEMASSTLAPAPAASSPTPTRSTAAPHARWVAGWASATCRWQTPLRPTPPSARSTSRPVRSRSPTPCCSS